MLGHKVWQMLAPRFETWATTRDRPRAAFDPARALPGVDADAVPSVIAAQSPDVVINCIGAVRQLPEGRDPIASITLNALLPHIAARAAARAGARFIHISSDCVFSGRRGMYRESDEPDATDLYGRSKLLGEVTEGGALTLRTSLIGRQLHGTSGIVEWFLAQRGRRVSGHAHAIFSGVTTAELGRILAGVIEHHRDLAGLYHVSAMPISKLALLQLLNDAFDAKVHIVPSDEPRLDRSLDSTRFREATGWVPARWETMIHELAADASPYDIRRAEN